MTEALSWYERLPKVELHLHLEGAIPEEALWQLVQKYGGDAEIKSPEALKDKFHYRDFPHFIETWLWKNQFLREYEDLTFIAEAAARDLASENIRYVEAFYSPPDFFKKGLNTQQITEAVRRGLDRASTTLSEIGEVKQLGVTGVGIGGSEHEFPPEQFELVFARARQLGF